jgi:hypothetical protein
MIVIVEVVVLVIFVVVQVAALMSGNLPANVQMLHTRLHNRRRVTWHTV